MTNSFKSQMTGTLYIAAASNLKTMANTTTAIEKWPAEKSFPRKNSFLFMPETNERCTTAKSNSLPMFINSISGNKCKSQVANVSPCVLENNLRLCHNHHFIPFPTQLYPYQYTHLQDQQHKHGDRRKKIHPATSLHPLHANN